MSCLSLIFSRYPILLFYRAILLSMSVLHQHFPNRVAQLQRRMKSTPIPVIGSPASQFACLTKKSPIPTFPACIINPV